MLFATQKTRVMLTAWAGPLRLWACLLLLSGAVPAQAAIAILNGVDGVREGQVVTGELNLNAQVFGKSDMVLFELIGPVNMTHARVGSNPSFMVDPQTGENTAWDTRTVPEGRYTLRVTAVVEGGRDHVGSIRFRVRHDLTDTERNANLPGVEAPLPPAPDEGETAPQVVVVGNQSGSSGPVAVLGNLEAATELPAVAFRDRPSAYTQGSGDGIRVNLNGSMPADADIVVIAWSNAESRIIDAFAHTLDLSRPVIDAARLDLLPAGDTQLQLLVRRSSQVHRIVRMNVDIVVPEVASTLPTVSFVDPPAEHVRGSGESILVGIDGALPEGADVLVLAWSKLEARMVEEFAFVLGDERAIPASALDLLPDGGVQLQLLTRINNEVQQRVTYALDVRDEVVVIEPDVRPLPAVGFTAPPSVWHRGSGRDIALSVDGPMPEGGDIVAVAWSDSEQRMVSAFAFTVAQGDWRIPADQLELLPLGRTELQLLVRRDNAVRAITAHVLEIEPEAQIVLPPPDPNDRPAVAFSNPPAAYSLGSGRPVVIQSTGNFPDDADLLVIAWSIDQARLVEAFAFSMSEGPFLIPADRMETLPEGDVIIQLLPRVNNDAYAQVVHRVTIDDPSTDDGGDNGNGGTPAPGPGDGGDGGDADNDDNGDSGDGEPTDGNPGDGNPGDGGDPDGGDGEDPHDDDFSIAFAPGASNTYVRGSGASLLLTPSADLPAGTTVRLQAWSSQLDRYVSSFAHSLSGGPWEVDSAQLDLLDDGSYRIDVTLFVTGQPDQRVQHHLLISSPGDGDGDASPRSPAAGFTAYVPSADTHVIYVAADGNDASDGRSELTAVRTLDRAADLMRDNKPDWLLLRRGDVFDLPEDSNGSFRYWSKGGRSHDEPMIVGAYGDANDPRPLINSNGRGVLRSVSSSHLVFRDLHFTANYRDPHGPEFDGGDEMETGISVSETTDLRFEACLVEYFSMNMMFRDGDNSVDPTLENIVLHRCTIRNAYAHGETDSSGLYMKLADGVTINECLFDHNGWDEDVPESVRRGRNHNIYFSNCTNLTVHGNIIARESYLALKIRCEVEGLTQNVEVTDNLFLACAYPMDMGANGPKDQINFVNVTVRGNVCVRTTGWPLDAPRGTGMKITRVAHARVSQNLFVDNGPHGPEKNEAFRVDAESDLDDVLVYDNDGMLPLLENEELFSTHYRQRQSHPEITFENNRENASANRYVDPDRQIETYLQQIGAGSIDDFLSRATRQDSVNWDTDYMAASVSMYYREGFTLTLFD